MRQVVIGVGHRNHNAGASVLVGDDLGINVERLGEIRAHMRGRGGAFFGENSAADHLKIGNVATVDWQVLEIL